MMHPMTRTTDNFMILCLNIATHTLQTVVQDLYDFLRPFTIFYDLLRLHGCYIAMPSL